MLDVVLVCRQMGWSYLEYRLQPEWFTDILKIVSNLEAQYNSDE